MISKISRICFLTVVFCAASFAQNLTVRDIMREPSIAGMRPDSEKLSPDGRFVVFSWNEEGKEPRNLYIVSTAGGGQPRILVNAEQNYEARTPAPESKLNYGLIVRDDFVKAREKNLGGAEFSPDSKRLLFTQNGDIYVLGLEANTSDEQKERNEKNWESTEKIIRKYTDLIPLLVDTLQRNSIQEQEIYGQISRARNLLVNSLSETAASKNKTDRQIQIIFLLTKELAEKLNRINSLEENYPQLRSNKAFQDIFNEITGIENRINVARLDYKDATNSILESKPRRITRTQGAEFAARWLDNETILYQSGGNFFALNIEKTALVQLSKEANPQAFVNVSFATPTGDAKLLAYVVSDGSKQRALFVPNYLDEFVQAPTFRRGFTDQKVLVVKTDGSLEKPFELKIPKSEGASYLRSIKWAADNRSLVVDRIDKDTKRRQLFYVHNVGGKDEQTILVTEETDEKWVSAPSRTVEPNPKNDAQILFTSEGDGFNHIYLATLERAKAQPSSAQLKQETPSDAGFTTNVKIEQLTKGAYEVDWAKWVADGKQFVFSSTENGTATRDFFVFDFETMEKYPAFKDLSVVPQNNQTKVSSPVQDGMKTNPQIDETDSQPVLLYEFSQWNSPTELFIYPRVCPRCGRTFQPLQLTKSVPESFVQTKWNAPKFIDVPSRDGKQIKSKIYTPANFDKSKKYPMVFFVHGAGYLQNTINGWNNYYREFMFNQLLTQKGYVVLDIDYRGSMGYGRDWRTDVYDFLGGKDYDDHLDAIDFAVKNYSVDVNRIGVYGGSYGGFMAEMLVMRAPEKIAAAAALRPVSDWKNYFASSPVYTAERLGFPDKNPEAYKRSSPISYAENLRKPLLILHGLVDDNVPAQDSVQLIEKLIRLEKTPYFEAMFFPSENHGFTRPTSWADEYERILTFFEKHLK
jgi:dipeptidyl aminopeptidase/acylaminoacyl peptidase